jgi:RNA polymerase sigma-70 factor (ECF subfamily)
MPSTGDAGRKGSTRAQWFESTHWSVVLAACEDATPEGQKALERLCRTYWYPLYSYVRRRGHSPEDAQDLTQKFFQKFLEKKSVRFFNREEGKFRTFLLTSLNHFLAHEWERAHAAKRGGGHVHLPWDQSSAESQYAVEPASELAPEKIYDRRWGLGALPAGVVGAAPGICRRRQSRTVRALEGLSYGCDG